MVGSELKAGAEYAFREKRNPGSPLARIKLVEHVRGARWKAKWIDPHPGLVDYVNLLKKATRSLRTALFLGIALAS